MLETLRDYGRGLLSDGDWTSLQRRHRDWYQQLVLWAGADWIGPRQVDWMARLDHEEPNIRSALEYSLSDPDSTEDALCAASALHDYWIVRGRFSEGRYWLDRALDRQGGSATARLEATTIAGMLAALQQDVTAGSDRAAQAHRWTERTPDSAASASADFADGMVAIAEGDLPRGIENLGKAIESLRASADLARLIPALYWLGCAHYTQGDLEHASAVYAEQLALTESRGEIMWRAMAMSDYGSALWRRGIRTQGMALLEESLGLLRRMGNLFGCAWCFEELGWAVVDHDAKLAAVLMGAADAQFTATRSPLATFGNLTTNHDACMEQARQKLGRKAFDAAVDRGRDLSLDEAIAHALAEQPTTAPTPSAGDAALTQREWQVAELVTQGLTNKAIADKLVISQRTVDGHVEHIRDKLGFDSRTQIATWLLQQERDPPHI
jgi:ATP/maltotriose-dependent transcriptional regulator MalT